jgi:hypothetical protein
LGVPEGDHVTDHQEHQKYDENEQPADPLSHPSAT